MSPLRTYLRITRTTRRLNATTATYEVEVDARLL